jgi:hypothetical protein
MKPSIDDLPMVKASFLVAHGYLQRGAEMATIRFADDGDDYRVDVRFRQFPNGGFWAFFRLPTMWRGYAAASVAWRQAGL